MREFLDLVVLGKNWGSYGKVYFGLGDFDLGQ
jgi:hypothetical protein